MLRSQKKLLKNFNRSGGINDWQSIPFSNKEIIRDSKIPSSFSELRVTSGSTGNPLHIFYSKKSVQFFIKRTIKSIEKSNVNKRDIVLNLFAYGNYVPGSMYEKACQKMGIPVMPLGAPNTYPKDKILESIEIVKPTVWFSVPSYALNLISAINESGKKELLPKKVIVAGEKLLESYTETFKENNIKVVNHFGLTECPAIGVSKRNSDNVLEVISDGLYVESIEENDGKKLVVTDLYNYSTPIIKYVTGDIIDNVKYSSRGALKEFSITRRADNLIKIQGVLIPKAKIIDAVSKFTNRFIVNVRTKYRRDFVEVIVDERDYNRIVDKIDKELNFIKKRGIIFKKNLVVPKTSSFKSIFIIDSRK